MFDALQHAVRELRRVVADLDPACLDPEFATQLVEVFDEGERLCATGRALAVKRVADSGIWRRSGHRDAAHWVAATAGTTPGTAASILDTARRLDDAPLTDAALRAGKISIDQARELAAAAAANPGSEARLVQLAASKTVAELATECRRVVAGACDDQAERDRRLHASRCCRTWTERDGAVRLHARLAPADGAHVVAALEAAREQIFRQARRDERHESPDAYTADALVALVTRTATGRASAPATVVNVVVDHAALTRGHLEGAEACEIPGVGPISAAAAAQLLEDPILKVLVTKGADVVAVAHAGRAIPARLRSALEQRDPTCVVPHCDARRGLQIHHLDGYAKSKKTSLDNLARLCRAHHTLHHIGDYELAGRPGAWLWRPKRGSRSDRLLGDSPASATVAGGMVINEHDPPRLC